MSLQEPKIGLRRAVLEELMAILQANKNGWEIKHHCSADIIFWGSRCLSNGGRNLNFLIYQHIIKMNHCFSHSNCSHVVIGSQLNLMDENMILPKSTCAVQMFHPGNSTAGTGALKICKGLISKAGIPIDRRSSWLKMCF